LIGKARLAAGLSFAVAAPLNIGEMAAAENQELVEPPFRYGMEIAQNESWK
jgi:hypothetical protein